MIKAPKVTGVRSSVSAAFREGKLRRGFYREFCLDLETGEVTTHLMSQHAKSISHDDAHIYFSLNSMCIVGIWDEDSQIWWNNYDAERWGFSDYVKAVKSYAENEVQKYWNK